MMTADTAIRFPLLCRAWGETDLPAARIVNSMSELSEFLIAEWLGEPGEELDEVMLQLNNPAEWESDIVSMEFEIGGVSLERVYHSGSAGEPKDQTEWDRVYALIRHWSQRAQAAESALGELVAVKALKDDAERLHFVGPNGEHGEGWKAIYEAQRAEYIRRQPVAWEVARDVLAKIP